MSCDILGKPDPVTLFATVCLAGAVFFGVLGLRALPFLESRLPFGIARSRLAHHSMHQVDRPRLFFALRASYILVLWIS